MGLVKRQASADFADQDGRDENADKSCEQWIADLGSDDAAIRRKAARHLSGMPEAVPALCCHLAHETDFSVRSILFTGLIVHSSPTVVEGLLPLLRSDDANLRNGAIEALQEMPDAVAPLVEDLLSDPDSDLRIFVVNVLGALPHPSVPAWLRRVVAMDPHVNVCAAAVDAMAEVGEPDDIPVLESLKDRFPDIPFITFAADAAIRRIRGR